MGYVSIVITSSLHWEAIYTVDKSTHCLAALSIITDSLSLSRLIISKTVDPLSLFTLDRPDKPDRPCDKIIPFLIVSIAAYSVNEVPQLKEPRSPAYSFGAKPAVLSRAISPAPNAYTLPSMTGDRVVGRQSSASYSLTGRSKIGSFHEDLKKVRPTSNL